MSKAKEISRKVFDLIEKFNYHATPDMKKSFVEKLDSYSWINAEYQNEYQ